MGTPVYGLLEDFLTSHVHLKGLDNRTAKAYRTDLEHLYQWLYESGIQQLNKAAVETYLNYLINERNLKFSTITRKYRVIYYYLDYLHTQGFLEGSCSITFPASAKIEKQEIGGLSKSEIDSFFSALNREYENLDNDFRRRICLRDKVMMELLFYQGIEISELLRLELSDYHSGTGLLDIRGKRGKYRSSYLFSKGLRNHMAKWLGEHLYFERDNGYDNYLFLSKIGKPLSMKMIILIFEKYRSLAGIEKESTPKDLKCSMKKYAQELMVERCQIDE